MGVEHFLQFIQEKHPNVFVTQDLLKIGKSASINRPPVKPSIYPSGVNPVCVLIDGESCVDRLYGGYFSDWVCGGQWNRLIDHLRLLTTTVRTHNVQVIVVFNGAFECERFSEWKDSQFARIDRLKQLLYHIRRKHTPPAKTVWMPPSALKACLRLALRSMGIQVHQSSQDHIQEVISLMRDCNYDVLLADGAEYLFFDPPRYMSGQSLKLTFKNALQAKEMVLEEIAKKIDLHPNRFCLVAAMLGNHIVKSDEFAAFHAELLAKAPDDQKEDYRVLLTILIAFARNLPDADLLNHDKLEEIGNFIFHDTKDQIQRKDRTERFVKSVKYYLNGTKEEYHKYFKPRSIVPTQEGEQFATDSQQKETAVASIENDVAKLEIAAEKPVSELNGMELSHRCESPSSHGEASGGVSPVPLDEQHLMTAVEDAAMSIREDNKTIDNTEQSEHFVPQVKQRMIDVALKRHNDGSMHPWIYQVLTQAEIKHELQIEESQEGSLGWEVFRTIRQWVYAILFDLNHKGFLLRQQRTRQSPNKVNEVVNPQTASGDTVGATVTGQEPGKYPTGAEQAEELSTRIFIKEWICIPVTRGELKCKPRYEPELVQAMALPWRGICTAERLWFRKDLNPKRMKAFLTCLFSDTPLMLNERHVPKHLLVMCCILRYMIRYHNQRLLHRHELDTFLAVAISPQLRDPTTMQEIPVQNLTVRGVHIAQLFMQGIEHAMFANDACGSPVPAAICCPWMFFDGKLFQLKLDIANRKPDTCLVELCNGELDQMQKVDLMRQAVLENLGYCFQPVVPFTPMSILRAPTRGRGVVGRRDIISRGGGQLEIAGKVVGRWGGQQCPKGKFQNNRGNRNQTGQMIPVTPNIRRGTNPQRAASHMSPVVLPNVNQTQIPPSLMPINVPYLQSPYQQFQVRQPVPQMYRLPGQIAPSQMGDRNMDSLQRYLQCTNRGRQMLSGGNRGGRRPTGIVPARGRDIRPQGNGGVRY